MIDQYYLLPLDRNIFVLFYELLIGGFVLISRALNTAGSSVPGTHTVSLVPVVRTALHQAHLFLTQNTILS